MAAVQAPGCEKVYLNVSIISSGNPALFLTPYEKGLHIQTITNKSYYYHSFRKKKPLEQVIISGPHQ